MTTTVDRMGGSGALAPARSLAPGLPACHSCGEPASTKTWSADPETPVLVLCGRCAWLKMGDTVGVIAALLFDLGAS